MRDEIAVGKQVLEGHDKNVHAVHTQVHTPVRGRPRREEVAFGGHHLGFGKWQEARSESRRPLGAVFVSLLRIDSGQSRVVQRG